MNSEELEFAIFCIENIALRHNVNKKELYDFLKNKTNILDNYIIPGYEFLHTQDKALDFFYNSTEYDLISNGIADLHCMSDYYLAEDLLEEYNNNYNNKFR